MSHDIGEIDHDLIVRQLARAARMKLERAEDVATWGADEWNTLAGDALGICFGSVRLGVLLALHEADEEIRASRRMRHGGPINV